MVLTAPVIALVGLIVAVYFYLTRNKNYWKKRGVVGPEPEFFFGNLKDVVLQRKVVNEAFRDIYDQYPKEKVVGIYRLTKPILMVRDLDIIQHLMIRDFEIFTDRGSEFGKKGLGKNLFSVDGDQWRVLRTRLSPIFTSGKLKNMFYLIESRGDQFVDYLKRILVKEPEQNVYSLIQKYTVATISACAFGLDIDIDNYDTEAYAKIDKMIFKPSYILELEYLFPGILTFLNMSSFPRSITNFFNNLVSTVTKQRKGKPTDRKDFMDLLLEMRSAGEVRGPKKYESEKERMMQITDEVLAAQAFVFYAGGYETSATSVSFLLHELALNQDVQDKVVEEINEVVKKHDGKVTYDCLKEMTYMGQAFDETLRLYPAVDPLRRQAATTYKIPGTDVTIDKDTLIMVSARAIHHDEKYFPNPLKFDPDRFSPENVKARHPCAYMPFGLGSRNCVGMRFAKVQSLLCLVKLLSEFRVLPASGTRRDFVYDGERIILGAKNGVPLKIVPRNSNILS